MPDPPSPPASGTPAPSAARRPVVLGLLGGVASGKSAVARLLAGPDGWALSADDLAHDVLRSTEVAALVRERFGEAVLDAGGLPDRGRLAALAFDPQAGAAVRRTLEGWIHPRVRARITERLSEARAAGIPVVVLDVPLLLENEAEHGLVDACDALIFVDVDEAERERRAREGRGWSPGEVARRESSQLPLAEKRRRAHHVLPNNGTLTDLEARVRDLRARLVAQGEGPAVPSTPSA